MLIQRLIEFLRSIPTIPLWLALAAAVPPGWSVLRMYFAITIIISLIGWTTLAREVRGRFLVLREEDFVMAARLYGTGRAATIYLVSSALGFLVTSALPVFAPWVPLTHRGVTLGASAAVFGWLGALLCYSRRTGGRMFLRQVLGMAIPLVLFGLLIPGIDNWAHLGGLAGGYLLASRYSPDKPESSGEVLVALVLLVVSVLAVPFSFLSWSF